MLLRGALGNVSRQPGITPARVQQAYTPLYSGTMSSPARVGQTAGNQDDDNDIIAQAYTLANFSPFTSSPAGVGSSSNQPISDLFDAEKEEAARQRRRIQAARGKRPSAREPRRQSLTGTATTTTRRLPANRPRRPVLAPTPPPRGASSPIRSRAARLPSVSPGHSFTSSSPASPFSVQAAAAAANEGDLQQVFQILANDVTNRVQNRRISGIATTNTITTVYKNGRPPSVRRNSTRISN